MVNPNKVTLRATNKLFLENQDNVAYIGFEPE